MELGGSPPSPRLDLEEDANRHFEPLPDEPAIVSGEKKAMMGPILAGTPAR